MPRFPFLATTSLILSFAGLAAAADPVDVSKRKEPVRVACVGDSITEGAGTSPGMAWPAQLQGLFDGRWEIRNFGAAGTTLLAKADHPYIHQQAFKNALAFHPDVVIVMLGLNDAKPANWAHKEDFRHDYTDLVNSFRSLPEKPRVFICRSCPVTDPGTAGISPALFLEQLPLVDALATELGVGLIDMHGALEKTPELLPDHVHPNNQGAAVLAATAFKALTGSEPPAQELLTKPNSYFCSHAVLQRGIPLPIWGTGPEGKTVTVEFAGKKLQTTVRDKHWLVTLPAMTASTEPRPLVITGAANSWVALDVLVGDVWLASGQSNMERQLGPRAGQKEIINWKAEVAAADHPLIRQFYVPQNVSLSPVEEERGLWSVCSPATAADITAVGYFFSRDLQPVIKVPIGLIHSSWGGTVAQAWTSREQLETLPDFKGITQSLAKPGVKVHQNLPTALFNAMIVPLLQVPIKGVIWYQGESNHDHAKQYQTLFPAMVADWRARWKQPNLPFLYVQIAPYKDMEAEIREAQLIASKVVPNSAMVVITDVGDGGDIHPANKAPVGARLALAARALAYGEKLEYSGPVFRAMKVQGKEAWLAFDHAASGLVAKNGPLKGFVIAGADKQFVAAEAEIRGDKVVVHSDQVPAPTAVRYGWANVPDVNLTNQEGLPASPFRTDPE